MGWYYCRRCSKSTTRACAFSLGGACFYHEKVWALDYKGVRTGILCGFEFYRTAIIISNWAVLGKTERILQAERVPRGVAEDFHTEKTGREGSRRISTLKEWPANIHNLFGNFCHNGFIYIYGFWRIR
jgi:hypothetical protein